jgi:hypothetical protein
MKILPPSTGLKPDYGGSIFIPSYQITQFPKPEGKHVDLYLRQ